MTIDLPIEPRLAGYTGYLLAGALNRAQDCCATAMPGEWSPRDVAVLEVLAEAGPQSQARLGELLDINRTIMVKLVDRLEDAGLVRRRRAAEDRRRYALEITDAGGEVLAALRRQVADSERLLTAPLEPAEHAALIELLRDLVPEAVGALPDAITTRAGFLITRARHELRRQIDQGLRGLRMEPRHFGLLTALAGAEPCSQQRLAGCMGVSGPAIVQTLDELGEAGLIDRAPNPRDRRQYVVRLTRGGRRRLAEATEIMDEIQEGLAGRLGRAETARLNTLLTRLGSI
ncbi:MarR family winged helix-turn-helix transcriptional regulator [Thermomonospora umbrina]|uniref:DNA-binding MarR family transcriptional regulator n=1 Tax=Thermomonospora umbrina TaxID=111806 RepID=A0A3D9T8G3_9ACTN|nr:MarR family winged helix-turn-helix transcriptional regulator [Thermomonospora umbrina]REF00955.1 DNA-binding MarR family transcriptional regulator [Thermomonospora umbrina]